MKLEYTSVEQIKLEAIPGSHIDRCLREAAMYALEQNTPVLLKHNDREHLIDPQSVFAVLTKNSR
jgi:hypothetical protein